MLNHRHIDARSRALAVAVAGELGREPAMVDIAKKKRSGLDEKQFAWSAVHFRGMGHCIEWLNR